MKTFLNGDRKVLDIMNQSTDEFDYMGLGCFLGSFDSYNTLYHFGGDRGFRSYLLMIPDEKIGLVLLANCDYDEDFRQEILHEVLKLVLSEI